MKNKTLEVITIPEKEVREYLFTRWVDTPPFWGSFFKIEAWAEPGAGRKITKVELTNDGVEFTMVHVRIP